MRENSFSDPILFSTPQRHSPAIELRQAASKKTMTTIPPRVKRNETKHHTPRYAMGMTEYGQQNMWCGIKVVIQGASVKQLRHQALSSLWGFGFLPVVLLISG